MCASACYRETCFKCVGKEPKHRAHICTESNHDRRKRATKKSLAYVAPSDTLNMHVYVPRGHNDGTTSNQGSWLVLNRLNALATSETWNKNVFAGRGLRLRYTSKYRLRLTPCAMYTTKTSRNIYRYFPKQRDAATPEVGSTFLRPTAIKNSRSTALPMIPSRSRLTRIPAKVRERDKGNERKHIRRTTLGAG